MQERKQAETLERIWFDVYDVMQLTGVSKMTAYAIMRRVNNKLKKEGKIVISGRVRKKKLLEAIE